MGVQVGEREDVEEVYRVHGRRLWWAVFGYAGDPEIASDAVAEAFAQALRGGDRIQSPLDWIWRVAFRVAAGELQRRSLGSTREPEEDPGYEQDPRVHGLLEALARLTPRQRASIILHYYAGYSAREVASLIGAAPATVAVHLHRGRRRLRELLEDEGD